MFHTRPAGLSLLCRAVRGASAASEPLSLSLQLAGGGSVKGQIVLEFTDAQKREVKVVRGYTLSQTDKGQHKMKSQTPVVTLREPGVSVFFWRQILCPGS